MTLDVDGIERNLELAARRLGEGSTAALEPFLAVDVPALISELRGLLATAEAVPGIRSTPARIAHALGVSEVELDSGLRDAAAGAYRRVADHLENGFDAAEMLEQATRLRAAALAVSEERTAPLLSAPA